MHPLAKNIEPFLDAVNHYFQKILHEIALKFSSQVEQQIYYENGLFWHRLGIIHNDAMVGYVCWVIWVTGTLPNIYQR